jgi:hypothetical protein
MMRTFNEFIDVVDLPVISSLTHRYGCFLTPDSNLNHLAGDHCTTTCIQCTVLYMVKIFSTFEKRGPRVVQIPTLHMLRWVCRQWAVIKRSIDLTFHFKLSRITTLFVRILISSIPSCKQVAILQGLNSNELINS